MSKTLRRSCAACAKAKHRCDLRLPKCSRCVKRNCSCAYANEPLTSRSIGIEYHHIVVQTPLEFLPYTAPTLPNGITGTPSPGSFEAHLFDPFDTYPSTNLPRLRVQSLMQHFISKIAFQYYPLDLDPASNPFVVSWWPLALGDPALFHVTLQTASRDDELHTGKGFLHSEILMKDSVSLLRHKIQDGSLAFQDATMNAVVTLAAIEHGMGNIQVSKIHIAAVRRMVEVRGGLCNVKATSPLTARMVPWVSMLVTGSPQFEAQDDSGQGDGVYAIPQWTHNLDHSHKNPEAISLTELNLEFEVKNIVGRLRAIFSQSGGSSLPEVSKTLSTTDLHDLTSFVLHRLLRLSDTTSDPGPGNMSECMRYGVSIYMFLVHGPTYYSHALIISSLVTQLRYHLGYLTSSDRFQDSTTLWLVSVGGVASVGTNDNEWFCENAATASAMLGIQSWEDVEVHLKRVVWLEPGCRVMFQQLWEEIVASSPSLQILGTG